jgi:CheY-like chemotaxis protein
MPRILIVEPDKAIREALTAQLQKKNTVCCAEDAITGLSLLHRQKPQGLILNLSLPGMDGLSFLEEAGETVPKAIISLSTAYPRYVEQRLFDLGVSCPMLLPCSTSVICHRLQDMLDAENLLGLSRARQAVSGLLTEMGSPGWDSEKLLLSGVPLFAQDRNQSMIKDFYTGVAELCGCDNWNQAESGIRRLKEYVWTNGSTAIREKFFPGCKECPRNRKFLSRLADLMVERLK